MVYKRFNIRVIIHVVLITVTCLLLVWSIFQSHLTIAKFTFAVILILQMWALIKYVQNSNKRLYHFMDLLKNRHLMERFESLESETSYQKVNQIYNEILDLITEVKIEKEIEHQYFEHILEIIGTCVISFNRSGDIKLFNRAACNILKTDKVENIDLLSAIYPEFTDFLKSLKDNDKKIFKLNVDNEILMLSAMCRDLKIKEDYIKVISFQNIKTELENEELDAWQKLIAVLRHEIMNSITPVNSLTGTIARLLSEDGKSRKLEQLSDEKIEKAYDSILAIEKRNKGLIKFVESYRSITKIPKPSFSEFSINHLFNTIEAFYSDELKENNIHFEVFAKQKNFTLYADEKLIVQVLINLLNNAIHAVSDKDNKQIKLTSYLNDTNNIVIQITDNGTGISENLIEKIFIPFFSTKESGSGIGLSLTKQIIRLHNASIKVESRLEEGTTFTLIF